MSNCNHPYITIDWVCKMCGYDLVVDANADKIRKNERERIIKLLDNWKCGHPNCDADRTEVCYPKHYLIELIKGEEE